jgi:hypothetical protein
MRPRIFIGLPKSFEVNNLIQKNLELLGYDVINISFPEHKKVKKSIISTINYIYRKHILNDRNFKSTLKFAPYKVEIDSKINKIDGLVDYTLLFRADIYPIETVLKLREKSKSMITYHWDGLHRFPAIKKLIPYFDRFFVFDPKDVSDNFLPTTNFYFNSENGVVVSKPTYDIYFMGSFISQRMPEIEKFLNDIRRLNLKTYFHIFCSSEKKQKQFQLPEITYSTHHISYFENLENIKKSNVVIDFLNGTHDGISFRVYECIQFDKKLITNNPKIKMYNFYHPNNIFLWTGNNIKELKDFLQVEYIILPKIKETYSFSNWINYVLDIKPHIPISLPSKN